MKKFFNEMDIAKEAILNAELIYEDNSEKDELLHETIVLSFRNAMKVLLSKEGE